MLSEKVARVLRILLFWGDFRKLSHVNEYRRPDDDVTCTITRGS